MPQHQTPPTHTRRHIRPLRRQRACAYCHGYSQTRTHIAATRFNGTEQQGNQIVYWFCDDWCRKSWLDRAEQYDGSECAT